MNKRISRGISGLTKQEKFVLLDTLFAQQNPQYIHRPAQSVREFVTSEFYLDANRYAWGEIVDVLDGFYKSGKRELNLNAGIGSGKSFASSIISTFEIHKILAMRDPRRLYGLATDSNITAVNMGVRADQAKKVVFGEIKARIDYSPWFKQYAPYNPEKQSELEFPGNTFIMPGNSKETTPIGLNVIVAVLDEGNFYFNDLRKSTAREIYYVLIRRIESRFPGIGIIAIISASNTVNDFTLELADIKSVYSVFKITWELNTALCKGGMTKIDGIVIPARMADDYKRNPERFKRDFMNMTFKSIEPYYKDERAIDDACVGLNLWDGGRLLESGQYKQGDRFAHIDLALKKDSAGLACGYQKNGKLVIDVLARFTAQPGGEIRFESVREVVYRLISKGARIRRVTLDGWQSIDSRQQFQAKGIQSDIVSVDRDLAPHDTLKGHIYGGTAVLPKDEVLVNELKGLELVRGRKVDHRENGSKDLADACAGVAFAVGEIPVGRVLPTADEARELKGDAQKHTKHIGDDQRAVIDQIHRELFGGRK